VRVNVTQKGKAGWEDGEWTFVTAKVNGEWKAVAIAYSRVAGSGG
jgi:hypothetical protein